MFSKFSSVVAALVAGAALLGGPAAEAARAQSSTLLQNRQVAARPQTEEQSSFQTLYVNSEVGDDSAEGLEAQPLRTVTRALEVAPPNTVIVLAPGRYSQSTGEVFPLQLKPGVTIQGAPGDRARSAIIEGGGQFVSPTRSQQNATIVAADRAGIAQVAVSNPDGYGVWVESASPTILETAFVGNRQTGLYVASGSPRVQGSYFSGNQVAGLIVLGVSSASIEQNVFDRTGDAIRVLEGATPEIVGNRMTNNEAGLVVIGDSRPVVRGNQMVNNRRDDVVEVGTASQDIVPFPVGEPPVVARAVSAQLPVGSAMLEQPMIEADAVPGELVPGFADEATEAATSREKEVVDVPVVVAEERAIAPPSDISTGSTLLATVNAGDAAELETVAVGAETNVERSRPQDGAPGAALDALQSGLALGGRAANDGNTNSPSRVLRNRRRRPEPVPESEVRSAPPVNNNRLAVPNSEIPLGSGSSATIFSAPRSGAGAPPAPPSRAQALGLYYRVFVEATDPFLQDEVKEVVPDAFRTRFEGRTVMQVGAFPTEGEAEDRRRLLEDNDFDVQVEYIR